MIKAIAILTGLVGYNIAVKVWAIIKMCKLKVEGWTEDDFRKLLEEDPRFRKYMR